MEGSEITLSGMDNIQKFDDAAFDSVSKSGDWLSRVQLMSSSSDKCKKGEFPINHYALVNGNNFQDLGTEVDCLVIAWRPKAMELGDEVMSVFDPQKPEYTRIMQAADEPNSGCMFGPEFLLWIPESSQFATFFMSSKSSRREAPNLKARMHKAATLKSHLIETKKYSWQSPLIVPCSTPFDLPANEDIMKEVEKFNNPPESTVEKVEDEAEERAR